MLQPPPPFRRSRVFLSLACLFGSLVGHAAGQSTNGTSSYKELQINRFSNCDSSLPVQFDIPVVNYIPNSNQFDLRLTVDSQQEVTDGETTIVLNALGRDLITDITSTCSLAASQCPMNTGQQQLNRIITVPSNLVSMAKNFLAAPGVNIDGQVTMRDGTGTQIGCLNFSLESQKSFTNVVVPAIIGTVLGLAALLTFTSSLDLAAPGGEVAAAAAASVGGAGAALPFEGVALAMSAAGKADAFSGPVPNVVDVLSFAQLVATSAALGIQYPLLYQQFAGNFGWSLGIVRLPGLESLFNRLAPGTEEAARLLYRAFSAADVSRADNTTTLSLEPTAVGITRYAALAGIPSQQIFLNMFAVFMIVLLIALGFCLIVRLIVAIIVHFRPFRFLALRRYFFHWTSGIFMQAFLMAYLPLAAVSFYQVTSGPRQAGQMAFAYIFLIGPCCLLVVALSFILFRAGPDRLYEEDPYLYAYGPLYSSYVVHNYGFFVALFAYKIVQASVLGTAGHAGIAQVGVLVGCELVYLALLLIRRPHVRPFERRMNTAVGAARLINVGLLFAFVTPVKASSMALLVIACVCIVLQILVFIGYIVLILAALVRLLRKTTLRTPPAAIVSERDYPKSAESANPGKETVGTAAGVAGTTAPHTTLARDRTLIRHSIEDMPRKGGRLRDRLKRGNTLLSRWTGGSSTLHSPTTPRSASRAVHDHVAYSAVSDESDLGGPLSTLSAAAAPRSSGSSGRPMGALATRIVSHDLSTMADAPAALDRTNRYSDGLGRAPATSATIGGVAVAVAAAGHHSHPESARYYESSVPSFAPSQSLPETDRWESPIVIPHTSSQGGSSLPSPSLDLSAAEARLSTLGAISTAGVSGGGTGTGLNGTWGGLAGAVAAGRADMTRAPPRFSLTSFSDDSSQLQDRLSGGCDSASFDVPPDSTSLVVSAPDPHAEPAEPPQGLSEAVAYAVADDTRFTQGKQRGGYRL
ncbi:hypothetical protein IWQ60_002324 [Tieghemiomyces parasiticus]|uniref:ML-like domain-containing protein n=1 Tax=Tieghemiomyces parasiticus TaxID=78921 RepID=A0A9W8AJ96_9FUNG|nr:hypothetical protein IWQ60_002324 [Tieghemiomyces parasiticus]